MGITYHYLGLKVYTVVLSILSLASPAVSREASRHATIILLTVFAVYVYRDIWPLATYDKTPIDRPLDGALRIHLAILTITGFILPLFVPRQYIPVDPKNPMEVTNPEQTASILSRVTFSYADSVIFKAYQVQHLSHTFLPPLADSHSAQYLINIAYPHIGESRGIQKRNVVWGLLRVFYKKVIAMSLIITLLTLSNFASPIALNRLLVSLDSDGKDDFVRPWFWILVLFLGRLSMSLCFQNYVHLNSIGSLAQSMLTDLIFEHVLRLRSAKDENAEVKDSQLVASKGSSHDMKGSMVGRVNTLIAYDIPNVGFVSEILMLVIQGPLEIVFGAVFLYKILGWSAIVGIISILLLLPVPGYVGGKLQNIHRQRMKKTEARVQAVTETIGVLRMVKMFGWENRMRAILDEKREEELVWLWRDKLINLTNEVINFIIPTITMLVTYGTHTLIRGQSLNASIIFPSMAVFNIVRGMLRRTSIMVNAFIRGKVALDRVNGFLNERDFLDQFSEGSEKPNQDLFGRDTIGFNQAEFTWTSTSGHSTPSRTFRLRINDTVEFKKGCLNLIVGPTGSGKTSILMALLGEMHYIPMGNSSWFNLPRSGGVAYAAQESWVLNDTVKNNILFQSEYDEERGGQKARVTLARAVYSSAEIILLDDVLAALDVHTANFIVKECLQGDLIRGRTVLLVTHNVSLVGPIAEHIVSVDLSGTVHNMGKDINQVLQADADLASELKRLDKLELMGEDLDGKDSTDERLKEAGKPDGKLILAEEIVLGKVSGGTYMLYLKGLGGDRPILFMTAWLTGLILMQCGYMVGVWFLGFWGSKYETHLPEEINVPFYLTIYTSILFISMGMYTCAVLIYNTGAQRASRTINRKLTDSVLTSTLRWLDETPSARIISRCAQDIGQVDGPLARFLAQVVDLTISMMVKLAGPALLTPSVVVPGVLIAALGIFTGRMYLKAQISLKRESSNARPPIVSHFGTVIAGLGRSPIITYDVGRLNSGLEVSIRAYGAQEPFRQELLKRIDHYMKVAWTPLNRWLGVRIDFLSATFTAALASYMLINRKLNTSNVGFSLTMSLEFCSSILWLVRYFNDLEVQANSLERVRRYLDIEHESEATEAGKPPAAWPTSGSLEVEGLSARYSAKGPEVLHNVSFSVKSGERIGIVGRTGSGKSSLTLSLLRLILTDGTVYYDGIPTNKINLSDLRSSITIIPQMPELLSGTLRRNLDPFEQHDDATLNGALRSAGLFSLQETEENGKFSLDTFISSGGQNLSVGQRQIIALARAIVRNSKLLILDEATSAIDHKTDAIIQASLRNELGSDVTVLTVAHRLQTIMDADKILVLDEGRIRDEGYEMLSHRYAA
uniref:P-loop containing nucleoside triphosphate hydrolase protein n=1 Tax=Psilocybe cubensis TaxID=181762 RepID=A0A8H7XP05_PSICU